MAQILARYYYDHLRIGNGILYYSFSLQILLRGRLTVWVEVQGERIPVVSVHDLIELKLHAGRKQDLSDVEHLSMPVDEIDEID